MKQAILGKVLVVITASALGTSANMTVGQGYHLFTILSDTAMPAKGCSVDLALDTDMQI